MRKQQELVKTVQAPSHEQDIEEMEENCDADVGRFRFENVLKSMVARLELYNGLAPI